MSLRMFGTVDCVPCSLPRAEVLLDDRLRQGVLGHRLARSEELGHQLCQPLRLGKRLGGGLPRPRLRLSLEILRVEAVVLIIGVAGDHETAVGLQAEDVAAIAVGVFFTLYTPGTGTEITQTQQIAASISEEEALETVAADYYSEELALMDYYQYAY